MIVLIETLDPVAGIEWGVSLTSSNPEQKDYIACKSREDAIKLQVILNDFEAKIKYPLKNKPRPNREELEVFAKPLIDILYKYYGPHSQIVITQTSVEILCGDMSVSVEPRD